MDDYPFDLGGYTRTITTSSPAAQQWFDRGLNWVFAYNHEEAELCFGRLEHDPGCAMAHWGLAYVAGPNYNRPWEQFDDNEIVETLRRSRQHCADARDNAHGATPVEQALIAALHTRYQADVPAADLYVWSAQYSDEMRRVHTGLRRRPRRGRAVRRGDDEPHPMADVGVAQWPADGGRRHPRVPRGPRSGDQPQPLCGSAPHPGLWHLYVHLMEMSPTPEAALRVGDELRRLVPDSGHLAHMPTHIDVLCGNYQDVVDWNHIGIERDVHYWKHVGALNFYSLYRVHNYHFKLYGAMFLGQFEPAMDAVTAMHETIPDELVRLESPAMADWLEGYMSIGTHALVRFGRWQELSTIRCPPTRTSTA